MELKVVNKLFFMKTYSETLQYLYNRLPVFHQVGASAYKPGLENTQRLVTALNQPQSRYKTIHVAGTNGKGSVSHFISAILQEAGYKVGLYTSPHLVNFGERIRINGEMIREEYVIDFVEKNNKLFTEIEPSFFETTMVMAFQYFADNDVDVAIIEVGLGGRLDSTNIIRPVLSIITNISFDHVGFLGNTLEKIASEKAGIIKSEIPVVIGEANSETKPVFLQKASEENSPIYFAQEHNMIDFQKLINGKMQVKANKITDYFIGLNGQYQLKNVATVLTAVNTLKKLDFNISVADVQKGLENVVELTGLMGRWQILQSDPKIIIDTGHNMAGIQYVVDQLKNEKFKTLRFIIGMVNDKDISSVLSLLPKHARYYFTQAQIERALPANELKVKAISNDLEGDAYMSVIQAFSAAINDSDVDDMIFIGGSNFVVGEVLDYIRLNKKDI